MQNNAKGDIFMRLNCPPCNGTQSRETPTVLSSPQVTGTGGGPLVLRQRSGRSGYEESTHLRLTPFSPFRECSSTSAAFNRVLQRRFAPAAVSTVIPSPRRPPGVALLQRRPGEGQNARSAWQRGPASPAKAAGWVAPPRREPRAKPCPVAACALRLQLLHTTPRRRSASPVELVPSLDDNAFLHIVLQHPAAAPAATPRQLRQVVVQEREVMRRCARA